jgi:predicted GTPase
VLAYSDLKHETVMHKASLVLSTGADFRLMGPDTTMLGSTKPVVAVCATRTGCGKSQTSRKVGQTLLDAGLKVALVRHPMPYGDLESMRVQRFATLEEIDASNPTVEEREEYEEPVRGHGRVRRSRLRGDPAAGRGGSGRRHLGRRNNDFPFYAPDR